VTADYVINDPFEIGLRFICVRKPVIVHAHKKIRI
jgi:hypothetical protein